MRWPTRSPACLIISSGARSAFSFSSMSSLSAMSSMPSSSTPSSAGLLRSFLDGSSWSLKKRLEYRRGGAFGTWTGEAYFRDDPVRSDCILYTEKGELKMDSSPPTSPGMPSSGRPLAFVFPAATPDDDAAAAQAEVYFVEDHGLRFFHALPFCEDPPPQSPSALACSFDHLCVQDLYQGQWKITGDDTFEIRWHVFGPTKDGDIVQEYVRLVS